MMRRRMLLLWVLFPAMLGAQGIYTEFGQNRVQHNRFQWQSISAPNVDVYFYKDGDEVARHVLVSAIGEMPEIERILKYRLSGGIEFMVFNSMSHFRQSNISYTNPQFNSGGYTYVVNDRVELYFNGDYNNLRRQIRAGITEVLLREMMFGGTIQERIQNSALLVLPDWFIPGLVDFMAEPWNTVRDNEMRDAISTGTLKAFNSMSPADARLAGHSIWRYVAERWGFDQVSSVLYLTRITRSYENGIYFNTRMNMQEFLKDWLDYYSAMYASDAAGRKMPKGQENLLKRISHVPHTQVKVSPDGKNLAVVTNQLGQYHIWLHSLSSGSTRRLLSGGHRVLNQVEDLQFPVVHWNPSNKRLLVLLEEKGEYRLIQINTSGERSREIRLLEFALVKDFAISPDGETVIISAVKNGKSDLYSFKFKDKKQEYIQITEDIFDDVQPVYIDEHQLLYVSNRNVGDTAETAQNIFVLDPANPSAARPITGYTDGVRVEQPQLFSEGMVTFLSDESGIMNAYVLDLRDSNRIRAVTNYERSIITQHVSAESGVLAEMLLHKGDYRIFISETFEAGQAESESVTPARTWYRRHHGGLDSMLRGVRGLSVTKVNADSSKTEIQDSFRRNTYTFQSGFPRIDYSRRNALPQLSSAASFIALPYARQFSVDYYLSQFDNSTLGLYYYSTNLPPEVMHSALFSPMIKVSISDLLKDYTLEGTLRILSNLEASDYSLRFRANKGRFHKDYMVWRRSRFLDIGQVLRLRDITVEGRAGLVYPFNEKARAQSYLSIRSDRATILGTDELTLLASDYENRFAGWLNSFVWDNTISLGQNLFKGTRMKLFLDGYRGINRSISAWNAGFDIRHYHRLHRQLIFAGRLSGATSFGREKTAWFMGGTENWINPQYNMATPLPDPGLYFMQSYTGNLRGYLYTTSYGSNYLMSNFELRLPLFLYFYQKPLRNLFLRNFMLVPFVDAGAAWQGSSPYSADNPFNTRVVSTPDYRITVTGMRNPWLVGTGIGLRSQVMGYFVKLDYGWGYNENVWSKRVVHWSIGHDF